MSIFAQKLRRCLWGLTCLQMWFWFFISATAWAQAQNGSSSQVGLSGAELAQMIRLNVERYTLSNGMTVLLHEDHSAPIFTYHQWYRVGSRDEEPGRTGLAHFFEHLMFKGTPRYGSRELDRLIQANGGTYNAFTSKDVTAYHTTLPAGKLELIIDIEADRMRNLIFDEDEIASEREVVKEERRQRVEDSVLGSLSEALWRTVFRVHPYRWPVIGYMADLEAATMEDLKAFYRRFYAPNNSVVVISGSFNSRQAKGLIERHFGSIPAGEPIERVYPEEPAQSGQRSLSLRRDVQSPTVAVAFRTTDVMDPDIFALDILAGVLGWGDSSRLHRRLVRREQTVTSISASSQNLASSGVFQITAHLKPGVNSEQVLRSIYGEIYRARNSRVSEDELERVKNQLMKSYVDAMKTIEGKARVLAYAEVVYGSYTRIFEDLARFAEVTAEQVQEVAEKYLQPHQRSVIQVLPRAGAAAPSSPAEES